MRYFIETKEKEMEIGAKIAEWQRKGFIEILEKGDPIDLIKTEIVKISRAVEYLKKCGINEDVMIAYIKNKGISKTNIDNVLYYQKEFLKKLGLMKGGN